MIELIVAGVCAVIALLWTISKQLTDIAIDLKGAREHLLEIHVQMFKLNEVATQLENIKKELDEHERSTFARSLMHKLDDALSYLRELRPGDIPAEKSFAAKLLGGLYRLDK